MDHYTRSDAYLQRALKVSPGGAQTLSKRANRFVEGAYPTCLTRGSGPYVWDVDDNKYLDFICGLACMTLGYQHDQVISAVVNKLLVDGGASFSLATELETIVAEKVCAMIPCAESVRFVKTGSEANEAAIRVARKATGKDRILTVGGGYHAWHSWFQAVKPEHPGVPDFYREGVTAFDYNASDEQLEWLFGKYDPSDGAPGPESGWWRVDIAAVILEPCHYEAPRPGFLQKLRQLCMDNGALLIFDEMVTGFRWANGGAQAYYGVTPDLATFGKACANGFPLSFLCGRQDLMQHADVVSGTFGGETVGLAACNAVLDVYHDQPIIDTLWARGEQFQTGFNDLAQVLDVPAVCDGFPVKPRIRFTAPARQVLELKDVPSPQQTQAARDAENNLAMSLFLQETAIHGILWHPAGGNVSAAMQPVDIEFAIDGMGAAMVVVKKALDTGDWSVLKGKPILSTPYVRKS